MADSARPDGSWPTPPPAVPPAGSRRRRLGYVAWPVGVAAFLCIVYGLGRPDTYWHRIGNIQIFEGKEGVVAFVEVELVDNRPGLVRSPSVVWNPVRMYRFDVGRDGTVETILFRTPAGRHYLGLEHVLKVPEGLFLVEAPSRDQTAYMLHRIEGDRIEPVSKQESEAILRASGHAGRSGRAAYEATERNGWRLLERGRVTSWSPEDPIVSTRHQLRLRIDQAEGKQSLVAESTESEGWIATLLTVDTRRWRSYRDPRRE